MAPSQVLRYLGQPSPYGVIEALEPCLWGGAALCIDSSGVETVQQLAHLIALGVTPGDGCPYRLREVCGAVYVARA